MAEDEEPAGAGPRRASGPAARRVLLLASSLALVAGIQWIVVPRSGTPLLHPHLAWWQLTLLFGGAEIYVLHVQSKREARTISLSELPLVLGLFFGTPGGLLVARLAGPLLVFAVHRRQAPLKLVFNASLLLFEVTTAITLFALVIGDAPAVGPVSWIAAYVAVGASGALAAMLVAAAISIYEGRLRIRDIALAAQSGVGVAFTLGTMALVAVNALSRDPDTAWLLVTAALALFVAYRGYASLRERHLSLERLYRFSQVVSSSPEVDQILRSVLVQARELLRAEYADITVLSVGEGDAAVRVAMGRTDWLDRTTIDDITRTDPACGEVLASSVPLLIPRTGRPAERAAYLATRGLRDAIIVPMRGEVGVVGTITVGDRMGDVRTFDQADVRLLETVANHASVALENGRLVGQLRHEALHDALTGLPNRVLLQRRVKEALGEFHAGRSPGLAVMIMDLDGFKEVNDTLGHQNGDLLLREVATRMTGALGQRATVARLGGDEFAVLLPWVADARDAVAAGRRLLGALEQPVPIDELEIHVAASIGLALAPAHASDTSGLLKRADVAMYAAKGSTSGLRVYDPQLDTNDPQRLALVAELRQAVQVGELELHVQPKAAMPSGRIIGVETLVRWRHPRRGLLYPDEFIPVAERSGLILPLTTIVLCRALEECAAWRAAGKTVGVAVNLSARNLLDLDLADQVTGALRAHDLPPELLTLELTESSIMTDPARTIELLTRLATMGVRVSIDDFGTGYSSLSYLKRLPVHEVKVDKSFVSGVAEDGDDAAIVRSILDLGRNLSLDVVAEGVESRDVWDRLVGMDCGIAQGYLISRPMPLAEFPAWLAAYDRDLAKGRRRPVRAAS